MKVVTMLRTCHACPAQWDGRTDDDRPVYVRYRGGYGYVTVGEPGEAHADVFGPAVGEWRGNHHLDGYLTYEELKERVPQIEWPATEVS